MNIKSERPRLLCEKNNWFFSIPWLLFKARIFEHTLVTLMMLLMLERLKNWVKNYVFFEILEKIEILGDDGKPENFIKMKFLVVLLLPIKTSLTW